MLEKYFVVYLVLSTSQPSDVRHDKRKAIRKQWHPRGSASGEASLWFRWGSPWNAVSFHHKTRKWKFRLGVLLILAAQLILWRVLQAVSNLSQMNLVENRQIALF